MADSKTDPLKWYQRRAGGGGVNRFRLLQGDALTVLKTLSEESVQCVVTSPPYWGLRDYGTAKWEGGDPECDHDTFRGRHRDLLGSDGTAGKNCTSWAARDGTATPGNCPHCGARRIDSQLGLEPTPEEHVEKMVQVFREVRRVLRKDGTLWLNYGDVYAGSWGAQSRPDNGDDRVCGDGGTGSLKKTPGLKPKDLVGLPWRLALALQADGWYLRSDIIWSKPNPMPESVTDRPTKAHEYLFLLTKSARYYYDADAVREDGRTGDVRRPHAPGQVDSRGNGHARGGGTERANYQPGRNLRTVWTIPTEPTPDAHFATFPRKLVLRCVEAATSRRGACPECGTSWARVREEDTGGSKGKSWHDHSDDMGRGQARARLVGDYQRGRTIDWRPTCKCRYAISFDPVPCVVLDPFMGSGTTGIVATGCGRDAIGIELNPAYVEIAKRRVEKYGGMFVELEFA